LVPGVELVRYIIQRMTQVSRADAIVLCTTTRPTDDALVAIAEQEGIQFTRGSTEDKLMRWLQAAIEHDVDLIATADGDDPFCSPTLIDSAFTQLEDCDTLDFVRAPEGLVCGGFTYALRTKALEKVCRIKGSEDTEMMWPYFEDTGLFSGVDLSPIPPALLDDRLRLTVDYPEDMDLARVLASYGQLSKDDSLENLVGYVEMHPALREINFFRHREWKDNQIAKTKLVLAEDLHEDQPE